MHVRPFSYTHQDYEDMVAIENAINPDTPGVASEWQHWDSNRDSKYTFRRFMAKKNGRAVAVAAFGHTVWSHQPDKYFVYIGVHPNHRNEGVGTAFYSYLRQELNQLQPRKLVAMTRENRRSALHMLDKYGFAQAMRQPISRINPQNFDASLFADKLARVEESGIQIRSLLDLSDSDPEWKQKVYELEWQCLLDVPSPDEWTKRPFEQFEKQTLTSPNLLPDAWFVAVDGEQYVGLSVLWKNLANEEMLGTGLTGVLRSHRRRGIATAMKVHALEFARAYGATSIDTDNEENNPMFQLNLQLGFRPEPAELFFEKQLIP